MHPITPQSQKLVLFFNRRRKLQNSPKKQFTDRLISCNFLLCHWQCETPKILVWLNIFWNNYLLGIQALTPKFEHWTWMEGERTFKFGTQPAKTDISPSPSVTLWSGSGAQPPPRRQHPSLPQYRRWASSLPCPGWASGSCQLPASTGSRAGDTIDGWNGRRRNMIIT